MNRIWRIFKEYYLFSLVFILILFSIILTTAKNEVEQESVFYIGFFFCFLDLFISTKEFIIEEYYKPSWLKKKRSLGPLNDFQRKGFKRMGNELTGRVRHYIVCVGVEWDTFQKRPTYYSRIVFNPLSYERFLRQDELKKFNELLTRNNELLFIDSIQNSYIKKPFTKVNYDDMLDDIKKAIDFLKSRKLLPIEYKEWEGLLLRVEKHEETFIY